MKRWMMIAAMIGLGAATAFSEEPPATENATPAVAENPAPAVAENATPAVTENPAPAVAPQQPLRIAVMDFATIDTKGIALLDHPNIKLDMPAQVSLNSADRASINSVMQGYIRMIDAQDTSETNRVNRWFQIQDNERNWKKWKELYDTMVKGPQRPVIIGAEYLSSYLGRRPDAFQGVDATVIMAAMAQLQQEPDFPRDSFKKLAAATGATHLIYGTVSDLRSKSNSFKGYGIETKTVQYQLDVLLKVVDLERQSVVYSNVYTGSYREQQPVAGSIVDNNIFQNLMTSALEQAAEDLYRQTQRPDAARLAVTPPIYQVQITPKGGFFFSASKAEITIDGMLAGKGGETFAVPAGVHTIGITAKGYEPCEFQLDVQKNIKVVPELK